MTQTPVILDTNIYISYLLSLEPTGVVVDLLHAVFDGTVVPALPPEQLRELTNSVRTKRYLRARIPEQTFEAFLGVLLNLGIELEPLVGDIPRVFRDPRDDYLYAYADRERLQIVVSGDLDVLAERHRFALPQILTPAEVRELIVARGEGYP
jgi:putative PIN family toxin of toxin-antitoxin system